MSVKTRKVVRQSLLLLVDFRKWIQPDVKSEDLLDSKCFIRSTEDTKLYQEFRAKTSFKAILIKRITPSDPF